MLSVDKIIITSGKERGKKMTKGISWDINKISNLVGKRAIVTGGNSGIGYVTALELLKKGASVTIIARSKERGEYALAQLKHQSGSELASLAHVDLSDQRSIHSFVDTFTKRYESLDLLINNAGVMALPKRLETIDGFEMQVGINHLGHFTLTLLLMPLLVRSPASRIVTVGSLAGRSARNFQDLMSEHQYKPMQAYSKAKFSNLLFALELDRLLINTNVKSIVVHPGISATNLYKEKPILAGKMIQKTLQKFALPASKGAVPSLYAATNPKVESGDYYAPIGLFEIKPGVGHAKMPIAAENHALAHWLWRTSEELTGVSFSV